MLEKYFSRVPGGPKPEDLTTVEPKQFAEKSVVIHDPSQPFYIEGYHRPSYRDPDDAVYDAIGDILSNGRVSRLYRSLVGSSRLRKRLRVQRLSRREISQPFRVLCGADSRHTPAEMREAFTRRLKSPRRRRNRRRACNVQDARPCRPAARPCRQPGAGECTGGVPDALRRLAGTIPELDKIDKVTAARFAGLRTRRLSQQTGPGID